jgi:hypothetical protein
MFRIIKLFYIFLSVIGGFYMRTPNFFWIPTKGNKKWYLDYLIDKD